MHDITVTLYLACAEHAVTASAMSISVPSWIFRLSASKCGNVSAGLAAIEKVLHNDQASPLCSIQYVTHNCVALQAEEDEADSRKTVPQGFLSEVFGGQLSSRVACEVCHHTSITLEPFMDLSLPVPSGSLSDTDDTAPNR